MKLLYRDILSNKMIITLLLIVKKFIEFIPSFKLWVIRKWINKRDIHTHIYIYNCSKTVQLFFKYKEFEYKRAGRHGAEDSEIPS